MLTAATVLSVLDGEMTALQMAKRLGELTPRHVVPALNELRAEGRVSRRVTAGPDDERPVARWRVLAPGHDDAAPAPGP